MSISRSDVLAFRGAGHDAGPPLPELAATRMARVLSRHSVPSDDTRRRLADPETGAVPVPAQRTKAPQPEHAAEPGR